MLCLLFGLTLTFSLFAAAPNGSQSASAADASEIAALAARFMELLRQTGDVRRVDPALIHPALVRDPACAILPFVSLEVCRALSPEDRRDYAMATINMFWLTYEYQLSLEEPLWTREDPLEEDPLELFPPELRDLVPKLSMGIANTQDAFNEAFAATKLAEDRLLVRHSRMTDADRANIERNNELISEALKQNAPEEDRLIPSNYGLEGTLLYVYPPFMLTVAKDEGVWKVLWFTLMSD